MCLKLQNNRLADLRKAAKELYVLPLSELVPPSRELCEKQISKIKWEGKADFEELERLQWFTVYKYLEDDEKTKLKQLQTALESYQLQLDLIINALSLLKSLPGADFD